MTAYLQLLSTAEQVNFTIDLGEQPGSARPLS
jgi:hypothetical protein